MATRKPDTGCIRPYRHAPADFVQVYLQLGQDKAIEEHFRTNWRCITRWIEECGGDDLRAQRAAITGAKLKPHRRSGHARRYVLGLRLGKIPAPSFFDAELMEDGR
jgi:hypothetical protein